MLSKIKQKIYQVKNHLLNKNLITIIIILIMLKENFPNH